MFANSSADVISAIVSPFRKEAHDCIEETSPYLGASTAAIVTQRPALAFSNDVSIQLGWGEREETVKNGVVHVTHWEFIRLHLSQNFLGMDGSTDERDLGSVVIEQQQGSREGNGAWRCRYAAPAGGKVPHPFPGAANLILRRYFHLAPSTKAVRPLLSLDEAVDAIAILVSLYDEAWEKNKKANPPSPAP